MTELGFQGKVWAVTGGASVIGLATSRLLSERGGIVCIADIDTVGLEEVEKDLAAALPPRKFSVTNVDVSNRRQVQDWIAGIKSQFGRLDGAANIAGITGKDHGLRAVTEIEDDEWNRIIGVNLTGTLNCLREELKAIENKGSIVNMASIHATTGMANYAAYSASKHGILGLTQAAAKENGAREIRVNAVAPGPIYTPMMQQYWDNVGRPAGAPFDDPIAFPRQGTPEEVANVILFLLGPASSFVSGSCYPVDGAWL